LLSGLLEKYNVPLAPLTLLDYRSGKEDCPAILRSDVIEKELGKLFLDL
jgi:hypothetical protein